MSIHIIFKTYFVLLSENGLFDMLHFTEVWPCNARSWQIIPDMRIKFKYLERP